MRRSCLCEGSAPATGISTDQILVYLSQTLLRFLDLPALDSNDQAPRLHVAYGYPEETGWPGATLHRAADGGDTYDLVHIGTLEAIGGTALTALPDAPAHLTDTTSTVQVQLGLRGRSSPSPRRRFRRAATWPCWGVNSSSFAKRS